MFDILARLTSRGLKPYPRLRGDDKILLNKIL